MTSPQQALPLLAQLRWPVHRPLFLDPASLAKSLVIELDGDVIGDLMLAVKDAWGQAEVGDQGHGVQAELGWVVDPTSAVHELLRLAFEELGVRRVIASCFTENIASSRPMERVGMRRETHAIQDALHRSGVWLDSFGYALLADEYRPTSHHRCAPQPRSTLTPSPSPTAPSPPSSTSPGAR